MRWALTHLWRPVGAGVMPEAEVRFMVETLFGGEPGRAAATRIDERVSHLPGLAGLRLVDGAVDRYAPPPAEQDRRRRAHRALATAHAWDLG